MIDSVLLVFGITECLKISGVPPKVLPLCAVLVGGFFGFAEYRTTAGVFLGFMNGLIATGVVNRVDHVAEIIKK